MTLAEISNILKLIPFMLRENYESADVFESLEAAAIAIEALETIRAEVEEIAAAAKMREDIDVTFTAGIIAGVIDREIAKVEGNTWKG